LEGETEGVLGVRRPVRSSSKARRDGVLGNCTEFVAMGLAFDADALLDAGVGLREASLVGGMGNPFVGDFNVGDVLDALGVFTGDVGEGGVDNILTEDGDLGEEDARS
jgi:hypothetical protein